MKKRMKKQHKGLIASMVVVALVAGTFAYYTSVSSIDNELQTKEYGSKTVETFTPKQDMEPGKEIEKAVGVTNTGDYDLVVRMKFDEEWARNGVAFKNIAYNGAIDTVVYDAGPPKTWTAKQTDNPDGATDGEVPTTADEETVVYKKLNLGSAWKKGTDGYFYYTEKLVPDATTSTNLLDSILLASNADLGVYETIEYYSEADKDDIEAKVAAGTITEADYGWTTTKPAEEDITFIKSETALKDGSLGYAKADYTLTITTEVCQATKEAVDAEWDMTAADLLTIKSDWALPSND